jgi:CheY-like chemotaxis protein
MSDDLVSVRMLIASQAVSERDILRQAIGLASVPIEASDATSAIEAKPALERGGIDIVLIDAGLPEPHRSAICQAARSARTHPIIVASAAEDADALGIDGHGVVTKPYTVAEAEYLIDRMLRARLPSQVLVVDDSSTMRSIVRKILQATQFPLEIAEAAEGNAALERLRNGNFDIIFLDYNMPGLNGLDTLAEIRREHPRLEVVMISSTQDEAVAARVRAAGAAAFLKKPFFPSDIEAVLHAFCGMRPLPGR